MSVSNYEAQVKEALTRMINVLRKYGVKYVLDAPMDDYSDWWLMIAIDIDDLYRALCREANKRNPSMCRRTSDGWIVGVRVIADIEVVKRELERLINEVPYRLHPDFAVDRVGSNEFIVAMKLYDNDVINALFRDIQSIKVERVRAGSDLWVRVKFLRY